MFESFRRAWRDAVDNFWQELQADDAGPEARARAVYREVATARNQLGQLDREIGDTRQRRDEEREQVEVCVRRERMARDIGDDETARIAVEYRQRHEERADVLGRKLEALEAERALCRRDLAEMERALATAGPAPEPDVLEDLNRHPRETEFQDLEAAARARAAAERLEELKRRARPSPDS